MHDDVKTTQPEQVGGAEQAEGAGGAETRYQRGLWMLSQVDGTAGEQVVAKLAEFAPDMARLVVEFPFGDRSWPGRRHHGFGGAAKRDGTVRGVGRRKAARSPADFRKERTQSVNSVSARQPQDKRARLRAVTVYRSAPATMAEVSVRRSSDSMT